MQSRSRHRFNVMTYFNEKSFRNTVVAALASIMLGACGTPVGDVLGFEREGANGPDEFSVVKRAPLTLPPDFGLRPPADGEEDLNATSPRASARSAVLGEKLSPRQQQRLAQARIEQGQAPSEVALLSQANALNADPAVRTILEEESDAIARESETFVDDILFWRDTPPPGAVVDASEEAKRLQENANLGLPATEGETPTITRESEIPFFEWPF